MFQKINKLLIIIIVSLFFSISAYSDLQEDEIVNPTFNLVNEIKKTVVFIGDINKEGITKFYATGALVKIQNIYHLITAKHVIKDRETGELKDGTMLVFFNSKDGNIKSRPISNAKTELNVNWIFHQDTEVDVAIIPFAIDEDEDDILVIPDDLFLLVNNICELYDVFFLSYQPGIEPINKISPIFRSGIISIINNNKTFYIDASAFPGNSGSPVFTKPSPITFSKDGISIGGDQTGGKFIGIIGRYIPYREVAISAQTGRARVIFEENTGLSKVWSIDLINEIINTDKFKEQLAIVKKNIK